VFSHWASGWTDDLVRSPHASPTEPMRALTVATAMAPMSPARASSLFCEFGRVARVHHVKTRSDISLRQTPLTLGHDTHAI
jgi:hypothetical protein